ncbi:MAG: hypothetical protein LIO79_07000 [Rikenellaceae bacterium]|nr:hypothetical protein [Rikenellaceae bacterium]
MKKFNKFLLLLSAAALLASCSDNTSDPVASGSDNGTEVRSVIPSLGIIDAAAASTRAVADYAVNSDLDPTSNMTDRTDWLLDVHIYDGSSIYTYGEATLEWDAGNEVWITVTGDSLFFPNYSQQIVEAELYPTTWPDSVNVDQSTDDLLLLQDLLVQNGTQRINPAHTINIEMRHGNSMLDFMLLDIEESDIEEVVVIADDKTYLPYRTADTEIMEYLVILPVGTYTPQIRVKTYQGAVYYRELDISGTVINTCYCVKLRGLPLLLSTITVSNWVYGEAIEGTYSIVTSYPTFRGIPNATVTLHYDNDETQTLTFNSEGEVTAQPAGRTIVQIDYNGTEIIPAPYIVLRGMIIDLSVYL